jgi:hypothetical protein
VSFLNQLKSQANALQSQRGQQKLDLEQNIAETETACRAVLHYLQELARQLNVIAPPGPKFSLDGKTPWPAMKLSSFHVDARKKALMGREVFDYIAMGWQVSPQVGGPVGGTVSVNFPPDLERVESRLSVGMVKHDRREMRDPKKNTLQALCFDYLTETRGSVTVSPQEDKATISFRIVNADGFGIINTSWPAARVKTDLLDELAKMIVAQPNRFA